MTSIGEKIMSNLKYAIVEEEVVFTAPPAKPYLVTRENSQEGSLTRRVEAALDADFANGSMPA